MKNKKFQKEYKCMRMEQKIWYNHKQMKNKIQSIIKIMINRILDILKN